MGEAGARRHSRASGAGGKRRDDRQPTLWRAYRLEGRARGLLSGAGPRAEEELRRLALPLLHRRPAPAEADPPAAGAPRAALQRRARVPALRVRHRRRQPPRPLNYFSRCRWRNSVAALSGVRRWKETRSPALISMFSAWKVMVTTYTSHSSI